MKGLQGVMREEYSCDLTKLDLMGRGVICADSCCINKWVGDGRMFGRW